jgi:hypothetical protein
MVIDMAIKAIGIRIKYAEAVDCVAKIKATGMDGSPVVDGRSVATSLAATHTAALELPAPSAHPNGPEKCHEPAVGLSRGRSPVRCSCSPQSDSRHSYRY